MTPAAAAKVSIQAPARGATRQRVAPHRAIDHLRTGPGFKLACGRLPDTGRDLCSQPTVSRRENAPTLREVIHLTYAMIDTGSGGPARRNSFPRLRSWSDMAVSCSRRIGWH